MEMPMSLTEKNDLLNVEQLAARLNLSVARIRYEVFRRRIPFLKIGRSVRFRSADIEKWLDGKVRMGDQT